jgi:tRNA pseudouridine65 synthase
MSLGSPQRVLALLYQDAALVAINKPSGLAVHQGLARDEDTVVRRARLQFSPPIHTVHRLDRPTSGVLLLALDVSAARTLGAAFAEGRVEKSYLAVVRGDPGERGTIDHPIPKDEDGERVPALSHFERVAVFERYALVRVRPQTGRFHQVRRHMKHLSCPLIGDTTYGKSEHNRIWRERFCLGRLALHCESLAFAHPLSGERLSVLAPLAEDFRAAVALSFGVVPGLDPTCRGLGGKKLLQ